MSGLRIRQFFPLSISVCCPRSGRSASDWCAETAEDGEKRTTITGDSRAEDWSACFSEINGKPAFERRPFAKALSSKWPTEKRHLTRRQRTRVRFWSNALAVTMPAVLGPHAAAAFGREADLGERAFQAVGRMAEPDRYPPPRRAGFRSGVAGMNMTRPGAPRLRCGFSMIATS